MVPPLRRDVDPFAKQGDHGDINQVDSQEKRQAGLRRAEEIFLQYIQQKKKQLAELAFETLIELAPNHPKREEFRVWLNELDQEVVLQNRLDKALEAGRAALQQGDVLEARRHLEELRKLDSWADVVEHLDAEIQAAEQDQLETADIGRIKIVFEEHLRGRRYRQAEESLKLLQGMDVPKVTLDFLHKRLATGRTDTAEEAEAAAIVKSLQRHLAAKQWQAAREVAHNFGERFPEGPRAAQLFNQVNEMEAAERRQLSLREGIQTFEKFLAEGRHPEAQLALKLLENLDLDRDKLAALELKVRGH
jgi:outer membrane protein assembly factor BamD (BamD/ComL family)